MSAICLLTRRLSGISIRVAPPPSRLTTQFTGQSVSSQKNGGQFVKIQPLKSATARLLSSNSNDGKNDKSDNQDLDWAKFQESIQVKGFDTGQNFASSQTPGQIGKKRRGGKRARKKLEKEKALLEKSSPEPVQLGGGHFPALRYSEEETARLLAEAYANLPTRTGKRGTKNLKRQRIRFNNIRKEHAKKKKERIAAHFRKMEKRSQLVKDVRAVYHGAPEIREAEKNYQSEVLQRWASMLQNQEDVNDYDSQQSEVLTDSESTSTEGTKVMKEGKK